MKKRTFLEIINEEIEKYRTRDDSYDINVDELNKIYERFDKEIFEIEQNFEASQYLLKATEIEALEYLKSKILQKAAL